MSEQPGEQNPDQRPEPERPDALAPQVYVAGLSDYNAGRLHGAWIEAAVETEELHAQVQAMLRQSLEPGAEEWAIHDYQGFGPVQLSEYESLETVSRLARGIAEHGPAFAAWAALAGLDDQRLDDFENAYRGHWQSVADYAEELLDEVGATEVLEGIPGWLRPYVQLDIVGFARDLRLGGDIRTVEGDGGVWVFEGRT